MRTYQHVLMGHPFLVYDTLSISTDLRLNFSLNKLKIKFLVMDT